MLASIFTSSASILFPKPTAFSLSRTSAFSRFQVRSMADSVFKKIQIQRDDTVSIALATTVFSLLILCGILSNGFELFGGFD